MLKDVLVPIHRAGWPFIGLFALAALLLALVAEPLGWVGVTLTLWCVYFFRDPDRVTPVDEGVIVAAADGTIQIVDQAPPPPELGMGEAPRWRVAVFMNVFAVHVNRIPFAGTVTQVAYRPGRFVNASRDKASEGNERLGLRIATADGGDLACVQIAGLIARRIRCDVAEAQKVRTGERFGMIRFGSRVDVYLPEGLAPQVCVGQRSVAGETVIADARRVDGPPMGEIR